MSTGELPAGTEVERLRAERDRLAEANVRRQAEVEQVRADAARWAEQQHAEINRLRKVCDSRGEFIEGLSKHATRESARAGEQEELAIQWEARARQAEAEARYLREHYPTEEQCKALTEAAEHVIGEFDPDPRSQRWAVRRNALLRAAIESLQGKVSAGQQADGRLGTD
jgi:hypothetical protein